MLADFAEALAAVEEVNRLLGLAHAIGAYHQPIRTYFGLVTEILREVQVRHSTDAGCLLTDR